MIEVKRAAVVAEIEGMGSNAEREGWLINRVLELEAALEYYSDPDKWDCVYAECRDEHVMAILTPEVQPWKIAEQALTARTQEPTL